MLALTASRVHTANGPCYRRYGLDSTLLARSRQVLERTLAGDRHMTRAELATARQQDGIAAAGMRLAYLMMHAELEGVVCSGARRGKQMTYALLAERAPLATVMPRDQALSALAARYVASHGPATVRDFCWWSGRTVRDARRALDIVMPTLIRDEIGALTYWSTSSRVQPAPLDVSSYLLPNYDEYLIAYKDRHLVTGASTPRRLKGAARSRAPLSVTVIS